MAHVSHVCTFCWHVMWHVLLFWHVTCQSSRWYVTCLHCWMTCDMFALLAVMWHLCTVHWHLTDLPYWLTYDMSSQSASMWNVCNVGMWHVCNVGWHVTCLHNLSAPPLPQPVVRARLPCQVQAQVQEKAGYRTDRLSSPGKSVQNSVCRNNVLDKSYFFWNCPIFLYFFYFSYFFLLFVLFSTFTSFYSLHTFHTFCFIVYNLLSYLSYFFYFLNIHYFKCEQ